MNLNVKVGLISGTGPQGKGIAYRWAKAGRREVYIGSRSPDKAAEACRELSSMGANKVTPLSNEDLIKQCGIVLLTVPWDVAIKTCENYLDLIRANTKIFVDITVPMVYEKGKGMMAIRPPEGSGAQVIKKLLGDKPPVVVAFKTQSAEKLLDTSQPMDEDNFICGPEEERQQIIELVKEIPGLRPINSGPLREAATIEPLVPFLININRRYGVKDSGLKIIM